MGKKKKNYVLQAQGTHNFHFFLKFAQIFKSVVFWSKFGNFGWNFYERNQTMFKKEKKKAARKHLIFFKIFVCLGSFLPPGKISQPTDPNAPLFETKLITNWKQKMNTTWLGCIKKQSCFSSRGFSKFEEGGRFFFFFFFFFCEWAILCRCWLHIHLLSFMVNVLYI